MSRNHISERIKNIRLSGLFDICYYRRAATLPPSSEDVLIRHYIEQGEPEGLAPNPLFDPKFYLHRVNGNRPACALLHYIEQGHGPLAPHVLFDQNFYLTHWASDISPDVTPLAHYITKGWRLECDPHPLFSVSYYLAENPDIRELGCDPLTHFLASGWREHRSPHPDFDCAYYLTQNPDVGAAHANPLIHFLAHGCAEGRNPSGVFDIAWYKSLLQSDPATTGQNPLIHYVQTGRAKGYLPKERLFTLDEQGMLPQAEFDVWFNSVLALLRNLVLHRSRRDLIVVHEDSLTDAHDLETVHANKLPDYLKKLDVQRPMPPLLLFLQAGDRLMPETLPILAAIFPDSPCLMTTDCICNDRDGVLPVLLPGRNPVYLQHTDTVPPFCLSLDVYQIYPRLPGEVLRRWFRRLVGVSTDIVRHLPLPTVIAPISRFRSGEHGNPADTTRIAEQICARGSIPTKAADVSVIICTKNCGHLLTQLVLRLTQPSMTQICEVIIVVNQSSNDFAKSYHTQLSCIDKVRIIDYPNDYNFSDQCNLATKTSVGEFILFLNDDVCPIGDSWLEAMLASMDADGKVGIVGPLLLYPDETVQHAGMYLGFNNVAGHSLRGVRLPSPRAGTGLFARNCSAVTGAAMLVRADLFKAVNGFDHQLATYLQDVDLCLRALRTGTTIIFNPDAVLFHMESVSFAATLHESNIMQKRGNEYQRFARRWGNSIFIDPFRNVNFFRQDESCATLASIQPALLQGVIDEQA